jgi:subtilase family serine protease
MLVGGCPGGISQQPCGPNRSSVVVTIGAPSGSTGVGFRFGFIGTSVASPEFAGALALLVQASGTRLGAINEPLYELGAAQAAAGGPSAPASSQFYHQGTIGFDGIYTTTATQSYNYIFGNGSPDVRNLFGLTALPAAGVPRTASNP